MRPAVGPLLGDERRRPGGPAVLAGGWPTWVLLAVPLLRLPGVPAGRHRVRTLRLAAPVPGVSRPRLALAGKTGEGRARLVARRRHQAALRGLRAARLTGPGLPLARLTRAAEPGRRRRVHGLALLAARLVRPLLLSGTAAGLALAGLLRALLLRALLLRARLLRARLGNTAARHARVGARLGQARQGGAHRALALSWHSLSRHTRSRLALPGHSLS